MKKTQKELALAILKKRTKSWVPVWYFPLELHIMDYMSVIKRLRKDGYVIHNEMKYSKEKECMLSTYFLVW